MKKKRFFSGADSGGIEAGGTGHAGPGLIVQDADARTFYDPMAMDSIPVSCAIIAKG